MILISLNMGLSAVIFLNVQRELNVGAIFKEIRALNTEKISQEGCPEKRKSFRNLDLLFSAISI